MKVFVTVGTMLPFHRLIDAMDVWTQKHAEATVFAQIGDTDSQPKYMPYAKMLRPEEYRRYCKESDVIVSHLGMGTLLTALDLGKKLVALPRKVELREVTSPHQQAAARWLQGRPGIRVVSSEDELEEAVRGILDDAGPARGASESLDRLIARVRVFVEA